MPDNHHHPESDTHGEGYSLHLIDDQKHRHQPERVPPIRLPPNQPIITLASLQEHLHAAMGLEISTVPLYLFGMYSIKPGGPTKELLRMRCILIITACS